MMQLPCSSAGCTDTKYGPGLHRGADRGSGGACRRCCCAPAGGCLCLGSGPVWTQCLGVAAAPCQSSAESASDRRGTPASPGSKTGGTPHRHSNESSDIIHLVCWLVRPHRPDELCFSCLLNWTKATKSPTSGPTR